MTTVRIILNPAADRGHAARRAARLRDLLTQHAPPDAQLDWCETQYPRHATELAATAHSADLIIALGGDGTVHEVVNGLLTIDAAQRPALGIVPAGSGNDFAVNLGIPLDPSQSVPTVFGGQYRAIDACRITDETGRSEYWNNTLGIGFSGSVNAATRRLKFLRGFLIYFAAVMRTILINPPQFEATLTTAEGDPQHLPVSMISVCNGPREGGGFPVAPNAKPDDGLLTYTIMKRLSRLGILRFVPIVMNGNHLDHAQFLNAHTTRLDLTVDSPVDIHIDGEIFATPADPMRSFTIEVLPAALRVAL